MSTTTELEIEALPGEPTIRVRRFFAATPERLWRAWTEPEQLALWLGPRELEMRDATSDLRVGGTWRFVHVSPDGTEHPFHGEYLELDAPHRRVRTFVYDPWPDSVMHETLELEAAEGGTVLTATSRASSVEARDRHVESGMEHGLRDSMARLEELLAT